MIIRQYQSDLTNKTRDLMMRGYKTVLMQSPTGSGKTVIVSYMLDTASKKGFDCWFLVHRRELIKQSCNTFDMVGLKYGVIAANFDISPQKKVQICSVGTLVRRLGKIRPPKMIVWDECHHSASNSWDKIHKAFPGTFHIGLTATPERLDGKGLRPWFSTMVEGPSVEWLIKNNYLTKYKAFAPSTIEIDGVKTLGGDFNKRDLAIAADKPSITGDAIREYKKHCDGARNVVFCASIEHSIHVVDSFNRAGIPAEHVDGKTRDTDRDKAISNFKSGKTRVLSNVDLFGEGFDVPAIEAVTLLRPTQSLSLYLQQVGRALRPSQGKECAYILDHAGNIERHGLPDQTREWSLDGREKKKKSGVTVKLCKVCFYANPIFRTECEECGTPFASKKGARELNQVDGELHEINKEEMRQKQLIKMKRMEQGRAQSLDDLIALATTRGYKNPTGWAKHLFNARKRKTF